MIWQHNDILFQLCDFLLHATFVLHVDNVLDNGIA